MNLRDDAHAKSRTFPAFQRHVLVAFVPSVSFASASSGVTMYIVTPEEALANETEGTNATKTWRWKAGNVRDFAWASSRKFIWDAMGVDQDVGGDVLAQSFFPNE